MWLIRIWKCSLLIITHSTRILEALHVDAAHVMEEGVIVRNGGAELVDEINSVLEKMTKEDYEQMMNEAISVQPLSE